MRPRGFGSLTLVFNCPGKRVALSIHTALRVKIHDTGSFGKRLVANAPNTAEANGVPENKFILKIFKKY